MATILKPAAAVRAGDVVEIFGNPWEVRQIVRTDDCLKFYFKGVKGKGQIAKPDTDLAVRVS